MHFKNARNASVYAVFRAFFTQSLAKLRIRWIFFCQWYIQKSEIKCYLKIKSCFVLISHPEM